MKKVGFPLLVLAATAMLSNPAFARSFAPFQDDTSIDVEAYCQAHYQGGASILDDEDPYSWYCGDNEDPLTEDDMAAACEEQYGEGWSPAIGNELDAHSWYCTFEG